MQPRIYQSNAIAAVESAWSNGVRSVLLVAPTGAGKTHMGAMLAASRRTLWVAHRRELVIQAAERLRIMVGRENVGVVMPGYPENPSARIQVGTAQTLLARGTPWDADLLVLDEAHHYMAEQFRQLVNAHRGAIMLGLTATPERCDGKPLGDIFERMIVAASYSELLAGGYIVPVRVFRPAVNLGSDIAQDPIDAWERYGDNDQTIGFFSRVGHAIVARNRWRSRGVPSENIEAETAKRWRDDVMALFRSGRVRVLTTVDVLTEGVDIPNARVALSCRAFLHVSTMLQAYGRVLRPAPGKQDAIIIDLCGATLRHGLPTDDREYSLTGKPISSPSSAVAGERESAVFTQRIAGVEMVMASRGALPADAGPPPPVERRRSSVDVERLRRVSARHGSEAAQTVATIYERMGE